MKLLDSILISLSVAFLIIGTHQIMTVGLANGYWAIMLALMIFFIYTLKKRKA